MYSYRKVCEAVGVLLEGQDKGHGGEGHPIPVPCTLLLGRNVKMPKMKKKSEKGVKSFLRR